MQIIKYINDFLLNADDAVLRLYYELVVLIGKDTALLQKIYLQLKELQKKGALKSFVMDSCNEKTTEGEKKDGNGIDDS